MRLRFLLPAAGLVVASPALAADLAVTIENVSADPGSVHVALFADPDTFREPERALARQTAEAVAGTVQVRFPGIAPGTYALMAFHDADGDGELDKFLGMIPTEGYALSNDPVVSGPPPFEDAAFAVAEDAAAVSMTMKY